MTQPLRKIFQKSRQVSGNGASDPRADGRLSWPMLFAVSALLLVAVAWAFFMGFMVGKGQNPEYGLKGMNELMSQISGKENQSAAEKLPASEKPASTEEAVPNQDDNPSKTNQNPEASASPKAEAQGAKAGNPVYPFARPEGASLDAWGAKDRGGIAQKNSQSADPGQNAREKQEKKALESQAPLYDYLYQVAAFKNQSDAQGLRLKLEKAGIRAKIEKSGKVHLVLAALRGSEADANALREELLRQKLGRPLLMSKKPVSGKKSKASDKESKKATQVKRP